MVVTQVEEVFADIANAVIKYRTHDGAVVIWARRLWDVGEIKNIAFIAPGLAHSTVKIRVGMALHANLGGNLVLLREIGGAQRASFVDGDGNRFLDRRGGHD